MNILLSFTAGILIGVLINGRNDTFIDSLRKWINDTAKNDEKKRAEIEDSIEMSQPAFRQWMKQEAENTRKLKRKLLLCFLLLLSALLLFRQCIEISL